MVLIEPLMLKYLIPAKNRFYFKPVLWAEWPWKLLYFWFDFSSSRTGVERLCSAAQAGRAAWHYSLISTSTFSLAGCSLSNQEARLDLGRAVRGRKLQSAQVVGTVQSFHLDIFICDTITRLLPQWGCTESLSYNFRKALLRSEGWEQPHRPWTAPVEGFLGLGWGVSQPHLFWPWFQ